MAAAAMFAAVGAQMIGKIGAGNAESRRQTAIADINTFNAKAARGQTAEEVNRFRRNMLRFQGSQKAGIAASGLTPGGSSNDVLFDSFLEEELQASTIKYGGEVKAINFENEASLARFSGKNAKTQGRLGAASTLISNGPALGDSIDRSRQ